MRVLAWNIRDLDLGLWTLGAAKADAFTNQNFFVLLKVLHFFGVAFLIGGVVWYAAVGCHGEWWDVDGGRSDGGSSRSVWAY